MNLFSIIFFIALSPLTLFGQRKSEKIVTDSSTIDKVYSKEDNTTTIFNELTSKSKIYYTEYFGQSNKIKENGIFEDGDSKGIWKVFSENGKLQREINHDKGVITYYDKNKFPFYYYQNEYKRAGDSIISQFYGKDFLMSYAVWNIDQSYIYNENESGNWTDNLKSKPTKFLLRYNVLFDGVIYPELIEFGIDSSKKIIINSSEDIYGFEKIDIGSAKTFNLTKETAIKIAKEKGLLETDSSKIETIFRWENNNSESIYKGRFVFFVLIKTESIKDIKPKGRSTIIDKFDVYSFNPWSGQFIEKKRMKTVRGWEENSGSSSGLLPNE